MFLFLLLLESILTATISNFNWLLSVRSIDYRQFYVYFYWWVCFILHEDYIYSRLRRVKHQVLQTNKIVNEFQLQIQCDFKNVISNHTFPLLRFKLFDISSVLAFATHANTNCLVNSPKKNIDVKYINQFILWSLSVYWISKQATNRLLNCIHLLLIWHRHKILFLKKTFTIRWPIKTQYTLVSLPLIIIYEPKYYTQQQKKYDFY